VPNGEVFAHVNCVTIAHEFDWYNGSTTKPASDFVGSSYTDRAEGSYTVTATDKLTGCVSQPTTVTVKDATVQPLVTLSSTPEVCILRNGSAILQLNNGESNIKNIEVCGLPLTIDLTVALTDINWYNSSNTLVGIGAEVTGLEAGLYTAEFTSSEGCSGSAEVEVGTEILSYNLVSVNGDNKNDVWIVDCLEKFPDNNVKVFNRSGIKVYEADGYNNSDVVFRGIGERGVYALGNELPDGTYFYIIDKRDGSKPITGYLELVR
jgi:gliding motility-associated-like protein